MKICTMKNVFTYFIRFTIIIIIIISEKTSINILTIVNFYNYII